MALRRGKPHAHTNPVLAMATPLPPPAPAVIEMPKPSNEHMLVIDHWFENGCLSKRASMEAFGFRSPPAIIFSRPECKAMVAEMLKARRDAVLMTETEILDGYAKLARASLGDLLEIREDGTAYVDFTNMTEAHRYSLQEYTFEEYFEKGDDGEVARVVRKPKIKFHDKKAALDSLARVMGMNKDRVEVSSAMSLVARIEHARERLQIDGEATEVTDAG